MKGKKGIKAPRHQGIKAGVAALILGALGGCSSGTSPQFTVPAGQYDRAFDLSRDLLREYRFDLERIDSQAGVITTRQKFTAGLATPWDKEQTTFSQEFEDWINQNERRVRITFDLPPDSAPDDAAEVRGRVEVMVYRIQTAGLRSCPRAIQATTITVDTEAAKQGVGGDYEVSYAQDTRFAAQIAEQIQKRLSQP